MTDTITQEVEIKDQQHDKALLDKAVAKFKKQLKKLPLRSVEVTEVKLCIKEKVHIKTKSFADKIMGL